MRAIQQAAKARLSTYKGSRAETNRKGRAFGDGPENYFRPPARSRPSGLKPRVLPNYRGSAKPGPIPPAKDEIRTGTGVRKRTTA